VVNSIKARNKNWTKVLQWNVNNYGFTWLRKHGYDFKIKITSINIELTNKIKETQNNKKHHGLHNRNLKTQDMDGSKTLKNIIQSVESIKKKFKTIKNLI